MGCFYYSTLFYVYYLFINEYVYFQTFAYLIYQWVIPVAVNELVI